MMQKSTVRGSQGGAGVNVFVGVGSKEEVDVRVNVGNSAVFVGTFVAVTTAVGNSVT
jgi:hypothetical protein